MGFEDVIADTGTVIEAFIDRDDARLHDTLPQPLLRRRIVNHLRTIAPSEGSGYQLSFRFDGGLPKRLVLPSQDSLYRLPRPRLRPSASPNRR